MQTILERIWREPAVFIGLVSSLALLGLNLLAGDSIDGASGLAIAGPFLSAIGIRQVVSPAAGPRTRDTPSSPSSPPTS